MPYGVDMINHKTAEIKFSNGHDANVCLDLINKNKDESGISANINNRSLERR